jgi:hypothetical protein
MTGTMLKTSPAIGVPELICKFVYTQFVLLPLRTLLIARVIACFLTNKPNHAQVLLDPITGVLC